MIKILYKSIGYKKIKAKNWQKPAGSCKT